MMEAVEPKLLTRKEVAKKLGVSLNHVDALAEAGVIPQPMDLGIGEKKNLRWRSTEFTEWMRTGAPGLTSPKTPRVSAGRAKKRGARS